MLPQIVCAFVLIWSMGFVAQEDIDKSGTLPARQSDAEKIKTLAASARANKSAAPEKSVEDGRLALDLLSRSPDRAIKISILNDLSVALIAMGRLQAALDYNNQSMILARKSENKAKIVTACNIKGRIFRRLAEYDKALAAATEGLEISRTLDDRKHEAVMLNALGIIYRRLGDYNKALDYYVQSMEIEKELGDRSGIARMKHNIGIIYKKLGDYSQALENYHQSLEIKKEIGQRKDVDNTLNNIGNVYEEQGNFEAALKSHLQALHIREKTGNRSKICTSKINIAVVYDELGEFEKALAQAESALQIAQELEHKSLIAWSHQILASVFRKMERLPEALEQAGRSHDIAREINSKELVKDALLELSDVYAAKGDFGKALDFYKEHKSVNDSIFDRALHEKVAEFQTVFEKEQELALLKMSNENKALELQKEVVLREAANEKNALELQKEVLLRNASLAVVALTLILGIVAISRSRLKRKAHENLATAHAELEQAMSEIKRLSGLIPICANCKKIRDDEGYWQQIEDFVCSHSEATFSHGICPHCADMLYPMAGTALLQ